MDSALPIIEVITFHANEMCLKDLGLFKEVRDMVAATTRYVRPSSTASVQTESKAPDSDVSMYCFVTVTIQQCEVHVLGPQHRITVVIRLVIT